VHSVKPAVFPTLVTTGTHRSRATPSLCGHHIRCGDQVAEEYRCARGSMSSPSRSRWCSLGTTRRWNGAAGLKCRVNP